jgi:hypothetical protein
MRQDWDSARTLFARAVELLPDGTLTAYLCEGENHHHQQHALTFEPNVEEMIAEVPLPTLIVKYRLVLVDLWQRVRQHAHVLDEAYRALPLVSMDDHETRQLLYANIFSSAVQGEQYEEAYLVLVSLPDSEYVDALLSALFLSFFIPPTLFIHCDHSNYVWLLLHYLFAVLYSLCYS